VPITNAVTDLHEVLAHLGYREIRTADGGAWTPTTAECAPFEGETTETVRVLVWSGDPVAVLRDPETGETVAEARKSCSVGTPGTP